MDLYFHTHTASDNSRPIGDYRGMSKSSLATCRCTSTSELCSGTLGNYTYTLGTCMHSSDMHSNNLGTSMRIEDSGTNTDIRLSSYNCNYNCSSSSEGTECSIDCDARTNQMLVLQAEAQQ